MVKCVYPGCKQASTHHYSYAVGPDKYKESGLCGKHFSVFTKDPGKEHDQLTKEN